MKTAVVKVLRASVRLAFDFIGGVHVTPAMDYVNRLVSCTTWVDAVQASHSIDLHVVASVAVCLELAHSLYETFRNAEPHS